MPRTKAPKKKSAAKSAEGDLHADIEKALAQLKKEQFAHLSALKDRVLKMIDSRFEMFRIAQPDPEKTLEELSVQELNSVSSMLMRTACDTLDGSMAIVQSHKKEKKKRTTAMKKRSLSCAPDDDGYLTGDSATSRGRSTARTSRARSRAPLASSTARASRSLSRPRAQQQPPQPKGFKTPSGKQPNNSYGMITPKMQPNAPQCILRRPKHGEMAVSMDGSPLMVNSTADHTANVNIPLAGGRMISLQPQRGLRLSQVPYMDAETQRQLQTLKEHLDIICAATAAK